jgi:hypothetical protein
MRREVNTSVVLLNEERKNIIISEVQELCTSVSTFYSEWQQAHNSHVGKAQLCSGWFVRCTVCKHAQQTCQLDSGARKCVRNPFAHGTQVPRRPYGRPTGRDNSNESNADTT